MTREEIKKQWELEFGAKYEDYQRANVFTAVDILDFAELVVNKLPIRDVVGRSEQFICYKADIGNSRCSSQCRECGENEYINK